MAIISSGYEGTVNEAQWSDLIAFAGGRQYTVADAASWAVTLGAADREVRIAVGRGFGYGVRDLSDTVVSITIPAATSGSRYDLIVAHRDWQANTTSFTRIAGTSARQIPARAQTPGTVDDQPLALVRVTAGQSQVTEIVDLRVWGGDGGSYARDELVLQYLNRLGTSIRIGRNMWERGLDALNNAVWTVSNAVPDAGNFNTVDNGGIITPGGNGEVGSFIADTVIPAGSIVRVFFQMPIWCPPGNYGGLIWIFQNNTERMRRRWHNHNKGTGWLFPAMEMNFVLTADIAAGEKFRMVVGNDPSSSGGVEIWDAYMSWSIQRR